MSSFELFYTGGGPKGCQCPVCKIAIAALIAAAPHPKLAAAFLGGSKRTHRRPLAPSKTPELRAISNRAIGDLLRYGLANGLAF